MRRWVLGAAGMTCAAIACGGFLEVDEPIPSPDRTDAGAPDAAAPDSSDAPDAGAGDDDADADAAPFSGPACAGDLPFGDAIPLAELNELGEIASVRIAPGRTTAMIALDAGPPQYFDVYEGPFPRGSALYWALANDPYGELAPVPLADPLEVLYEQAPIAAGTHVLMSASRQQPDQRLGAPTPQVLPMDAGANVTDPWSVAGTGVLYFTVEPGELGSRDVYRAERSGGAWTGGPVSGLSSALDEAAPVVTDDEQTIYFARRDGAAEDIYVATRSSKTAAWGSALPLASATINTAAAERPTWISPNNCTLFFTSDRGGSWRAYRVDRRRL